CGAGARRRTVYISGRLRRRTAANLSPPRELTTDNRQPKTGNQQLPSPHTPPALCLGAGLDLADALAGEAEDLADVAEGQLVVLQDSVAELEDGLVLERQGL